MTWNAGKDNLGEDLSAVTKMNNAGNIKSIFYPAKCTTLNVGNESIPIFHVKQKIRTVGKV